MSSLESSRRPAGRVSALSRAIDWFISGGNRDRTELLRAQMYVVLSLLTALNTAFFAVLHHVHHVPGSNLTVVHILWGMCGVSLLLPFLLKLEVKVWVLHGLFLTVLQGGVSSVAWFDNGLRSGSMFWMVVAPLAAAFMGGARLGWISSSISLVSGLSLYLATATGHAFPVSMAAADASLHYVINLVCVVTFVGAIAALYEGPMARHLGDLSSRLRTINEDLRHELAERRRAQTEAEAANRAKDALLANMSHEFRTPLTSILGFTELLAEEVDPDLRTFLDSIERGGRRLLDTLNGVLDLAWIESSEAELELHPLDAQALVSDVSAQFLPIAARRGLTFKVSSDAAYVRADDESLRRALAAVVDNAVRFCERGGITVSLVVEGADAVICVEDTGIGMVESFVPIASDPFRQASEGDARTHEGVGLGLTIARRLMEIMGGEVSIDSAPGQGTTICLRLPTHTPLAVEARERAR